jgi:hypothetical protein
MSENTELRLAAMTNSAMILQNRFRGSSGNPELTDMLDLFRLFAIRYFTFLKEKSKTADLLKSDELLDDVLTNFQEIWSNISRTCEQHLAFPAKMAEVNAKAQAYYDLFSGGKRAKAKTIVYFEKQTAITRYDFMAYALVSLPLQYLNDPANWQGLAHEIGHHIYWNSGATSDDVANLQKELRRRIWQALTAGVNSANYEDFAHLSALSDLWVYWLEETFADISGTLMAGWDYVLSGINIIADDFRVLKLLLDEEDEHPSPSIRPLIALAVLDEVVDSEDSKASEIAVLRQRWQAILAQASHDSAVSSTSNGLQENEIIRSIPKVVRAILATPWPDQNGVHKPFRDLFNYTTWLPDTPSILYLGEQVQSEHQTFSKVGSDPNIDSLFERAKGVVRVRERIKTSADVKRAKILDVIASFALYDDAEICRCGKCGKRCCKCPGS